jgi:hypothetical protein
MSRFEEFLHLLRGDLLSEEQELFNGVTTDFVDGQSEAPLVFS